MKNLFVVAVATGIFTGTSTGANAQTSVNPERLNAGSKSAQSIRFINNIEFTPGTAMGEAGSYSKEPAVKETAAAPSFPAKYTGSAAIEKCSRLQFKYALLTDREVESITNFSLYNFIDDWWGTRYRYGGADKKGIDCSAFTGRLMEAIYNITLPRTAKEQFQVCDMVADEDLQEGDLVFFNTTGGISHVGVYLGNNYFVHSSASGGVTISSLEEDYYSKRLLGGGRVKK